MSDTAASPTGGELPLRQRVVRALGWSAGGRVVAQAVSWVITLVVIRLLTPADYGLMALAMIFVTLFGLLSELGMGSALIQVSRLTDDQIRQTFGIVIVIQLALAVLTLAAALPIAAFFNEPRLAPIVELSSLQFAIVAFWVIPEALLMRVLNFRLKAYVDTVGQLVGSVTTLGLAYLGYGVWALVWGVLATSAAKAIGFTVAARFFVWPQFSMRGMGAIISFGSLLTAERIFWFLYSQADNVILGKRFGGEVLGIYSVALQLAALPMDKVGPIIGQVAFPAFAEVQRRPHDATEYLLKAIRLIALCSFPMMFGLSTVAPWFVPLVLGPKWHDAVLPLQLLALAIPLRFVGLALPPFLKGLGYPRLSLTNTIITAVILPLSFLIGSFWGVVGVCSAWLIGYPLCFGVTVVRAGRVAPVTLAAVLRAMAPAASASAAMSGGLWLVAAALPPSLGPIVELALLVPLGAVIYGGLMLAFNRAACYEALELARPRRSARSARATSRGLDSKGSPLAPMGDRG
jgi:O-antigen/teichoic acid export membrane protein